MVGFRYFRFFSVFGIPTSVSVSVFRNIAISVIFFGYRAALVRINDIENFITPLNCKVDKSGQFEVDKSGQFEVDKSGQFEVDKSGQFEVDKSGQFEVDKSGQFEVGKSGQFKVDIWKWTKGGTS